MFEFLKNYLQILETFTQFKHIREVDRDLSESKKWHFIGLLYPAGVKLSTVHLTIWFALLFVPGNAGGPMLTCVWYSCYGTYKTGCRRYHCLDVSRGAAGVQ